MMADSTTPVGSNEEEEQDQSKHSRRAFLATAGGAVAAASAFGSVGSAAAAADHYLTKIPRSKQTYYWITSNLHDPFYVPGIAGMKAFGKHFGVKVGIVGPQDQNFAAEATLLEALLVKPNTAGIFSYFVDSHTNGPLYKEAFDRKIPIVNGAGDWGFPRITSCAFDTTIIPKVAVDTIAAALNGTGRVGYIGILENNPPLVAQEKVFEQYMAQKYPKLKFVGKSSYDGSSAGGIRSYSAFVGAHQPDAMFWGDGQGPSVIDGLVAAAPKVKVMLMGLSPQSLAAVKNGKALGACDRNTFDEEFWGFQPLYYAVNGGYRGPDTINVSVISVTPANVAAYIKNPYQSQTVWV
jgi:ABC-type sugar transport system substrate-binding protein